MEAVFSSGSGGFFLAITATEKTTESTQTMKRRWIFMAAAILQPERFIP
jgi:hypothetical protein